MYNYNEDAAESGQPQADSHGDAAKCTAFQTTAALLTLQLGWGLWLLPCDFARLGWIPGFGVLLTLCLATMYSGSLFTRLYQAVPKAVLFGDIGEAAAGRTGRSLVYGTIYSLDATRCIILHLAATQSLYHAVLPSLPPHLQQRLPLWQCSAVVAVVVLLLGQIRYLTQLSSFFLTGTAAQAVALAIVLYDFIVHWGVPSAPPNDVGDSGLMAVVPGPHPHYPRELDAAMYGTQLVAGELHVGNWTPAAMAVLNMVFAFGGQFAFLELLTSMRTPSQFTGSVVACTAIMTAMYGSLGAVGYGSKGSSMHGIAVFNMTPGRAAQIAAAFIFIQALAQYLVNLNVWSHNLLVLVRRSSRRAHHRDANWEEAEGPAPSTGDHHSSHWLAATAFVAAYSAVIAVAVPFFCTLVGLVTSVTYLTCAYTLPAWFALKLLAGRLGALERAWLIALIPVTLCLSGVGLLASVKTYVIEAAGGEGM